MATLSPRSGRIDYHIIDSDGGFCVLLADAA